MQIGRCIRSFNAQILYKCYEKNVNVVLTFFSFLTRILICYFLLIGLLLQVKIAILLRIFFALITMLVFALNSDR